MKGEGLGHDVFILERQQKEGRGNYLPKKTSLLTGGGRHGSVRSSRRKERKEGGASDLSVIRTEKKKLFSSLSRLWV